MENKQTPTFEVPKGRLFIVTDTREQRPYGFASYDVVMERGTLLTGDYSLSGHESRIAIERKSTSDLLACLTKHRDRFERELERARDLECFAVVLETSMDAVRRGYYRSNIRPNSALQSILAFQVRYGAPFVWAGNREGGEYCTYWLLHKYAREIEARQKEVQSVAALEGMGNREAMNIEARQT